MKIHSMAKKQFIDSLTAEVARIDESGVSKRNEVIIEGFTKDHAPRAIIAGKNYHVFNSNDYLGLRLDSDLAHAEEEATQTFGVGPGAVRFISGTLHVYKELESAVATFHGRDDAMVFSSAFAANIAVMSCFLNKQSRDSVMSDSVAVISDELNHRSIIDGVRAASIEKSQKFIYRHMDFDHLAEVLDANKDTFKRAVVVTDGIFSMIGEYTDLKKLKEVTDRYDELYEEGVLVIVDDSHGVGAFGETGRGCEEVSAVHVDIVVGTFGKAFGCDGGYVVGDQAFIDYLREAAATYIYSNSVSPGVAGAALRSVETVMSEKGQALLGQLRKNIALFKEEIGKTKFAFAAESTHPIQPILIGDALKTKELKKALFARGILVTNINYPVVAKGKDEIRVQINASHSEEDIRFFVEQLAITGKEMGII